MKKKTSGTSQTQGGTPPEGTASEFEEPAAAQETPQDLELEEGEEAETTFEVPPIEEQADEEEAAAEEEVFGVDDALLQLKADIETQLSQQTSAEATAGTLAEDAYEGPSNIQGVGLGIADDELAPDFEPGTAVLNVYVADYVPENDVRSILADTLGIAAAASTDLPINVIESGVIEAQPHRFRIRPAPAGVSVGHYKITCGTLGCLAVATRPPSKTKRLLVLSNNHVLANQNNAKFGDPILQPGRCDGGKVPGDRIAILERFVPINFSGGANYVDCATGWAWPKLVRKEVIFLSRGARRYFRVSSRARVCRVGMLVGKSGRTTQLTAGRIVDCNATIKVNYRPRVALFRDQIAIRGQGGKPFSAGGDSGSLVWSYPTPPTFPGRNPVGLLFAGGSSLTFANKIPRVLKALQISLYT